MRKLLIRHNLARSNKNTLPNPYFQSTITSWSNDLRFLQFKDTDLYNIDVSVCLVIPLNEKSRKGHQFPILVPLATFWDVTELWVGWIFLDKKFQFAFSIWIDYLVSNQKKTNLYSCNDLFHSLRHQLYFQIQILNYELYIKII